RTAMPSAGPANPSGPFQNGRARYPGDISYQGGSVVAGAQSHAVYVLNSAANCTSPACWGNPEQFLQDLGASEFVKIVDQYTGSADKHRYTAGSHVFFNFPPPVQPLTDIDMLVLVHAVAAQTKQTGYGHIYHVFLPPGTDECFDSTFAHCYSP